MSRITAGVLCKHAPDADAHPMIRWRWVLVGVLGLAAVGYAAVPVGPGLQDVYYLAVGSAALAAAAAGVWLNRPGQRHAWLAILGGLGLWVVGDFLWSMLYAVLEIDPFPSVADVCYLAGYAGIAGGLTVLARRREPGGDRTAALDAAIIATGAGVLAAVFVIQPTVTDVSQSVAGRIVGTAYPVGDLLLLAVLVRLWAADGRRLVAHRALVAAFACTLVGDITYNVQTLAGIDTPDVPWSDVALLAGYVFAAAATLHPSVRALADPVPGRTRLSTPGRLTALVLASMLPPATLLVQGARGVEIEWLTIGLGSMLLFALVLARVGGLLRQVQEQADALDVLARHDGLTGIPNRRTWDHELHRASAGAGASEHGGTLWVAMLDLDHFKDYNDGAGHAAGDRLLREAAAAWRVALPPDAFLARYGGEEFAVLFRDRTLAQVYAAVEALRTVTPGEQTFSAGLAGSQGAEEPAALVARADAELYRAKAAGRGRTLPVPARDAATVSG
jgi:diguanylate cyclase (GGDEF)-like protein